MKFLKEDYGQSVELDTFVYQSRYRFNTYYKVVLTNPLSTPKIEERYFAFEDAAKDYYKKLIDDIKDYGWDNAEVNLIKVKVTAEEDELDSSMFDETDDEIIEDNVEIDKE